LLLLLPGSFLGNCLGRSSNMEEGWGGVVVVVVVASMHCRVQENIRGKELRFVPEFSQLVCMMLQ